MDSRVIGIFVVFTIFIEASVSFPTGPPVGMDGLCASMTPQHNATAQATTRPYNWTFSVTCYTPGQPVIVTISGINNTTFTGFLVEARDMSDGNSSYGEFSTFNNDPDIQPLDCFGGSKNAVGHKNLNKTDWSQKSFTWTPPASLNFSHIIFKTTIVEETDEFWINWENHLTLCPSQAITTQPTGNTTVGVTSTFSLLRGSVSVVAGLVMFALKAIR